MKKILFILLFGSPIWAMHTLTAVDSNVSVLLNGNPRMISKNKTIKFLGGKVCFKNKQGKLNIDNLTIVDANTKCLYLKKKEGFSFSKFIEEEKDKISFLLSPAHETGRNGVSRGAITNVKTKQKIVKLNTLKEKLIIKSDNFGPPPVKLYIKDNNGTIVNVFENILNPPKTLFIINKTLLKNGYKLEVKDGIFNEILWSAKIEK